MCFGDQLGLYSVQFRFEFSFSILQETLIRSFLRSAMLSNGGGGRFYWARNQSLYTGKVKGIVVIFAWVSIQEIHLKNYVNLYSSLGWNSLVCLSDFLNPFFPERATSLAFALLNELVEELKIRPCPLVLAAFSGGSKACMYKIFQVIEGACEAQLSQDDTRLIRNCISGHIYDSSPVDFTSDLGAQFTLHPTIRRIPGSAKLVSLIAKGVGSGLDALFLTRFGSHRTEYWQTLYSSVVKNDDLAPYSVICSFAQRLQDLGGNVKFVKWNGSPHVGTQLMLVRSEKYLGSQFAVDNYMVRHYKHYPIQYRAAVTELLEHAVSVYSQKIQGLGERSAMEGMHDQISELICDLQNAAVNSNQSFRRVAQGPNDHFFLPSSAEYSCNKESGSLQDEQKGPAHLPNPPSMSAHTLLGQILFDACVPKNIEGWDIKFCGSLNGQPLASAQKRSPLNPIKRICRSKL
ncbi:unnamed protein product [Camellia sinensis]